MELKAIFNQEDINNFANTYGEEKAAKMYQCTKDYTQKLIRSSKLILKGTQGNGELWNSLHADIKVSSDRVIGEVNAAAPHARFVHEGAKHKGSSRITSYFVPFKVAPGLWDWLKRNKIAYEKTAKNEESSIVKKVFRKKPKQWFVKSKATGKEYRIDPKKGGMTVRIEPLKYFEIPFNELRGKYVEDMKRIMNE